MDIRTISIEEIGLSVRSLNALRRAEVRTVGNMLQHTEESLMQIRNLGRKSVQEILEKIAEYKKKYEVINNGYYPIVDLLDKMQSVDSDFAVQYDEGTENIFYESNW